MTLVLAVGFAVVGVAGAASAHHNTISGTVACKAGGGWAVTWTVVNSETITETVTASTNTAVVPVGAQLTGSQSRNFAQTVTAKPTAPLTLGLSARWSNGQTASNTGSIPVADFKDACNITTVTAPTVPVIDDCGPGNARFGEVPAGPWSSQANPDGSLTITADRGYAFSGGRTSVTYPAPTDSNEACPTPPTPPVVTPPVVTPPEVLPAEVRVVRARARSIDKCGSRSDLFKVSKRTGVVYRSGGKELRQGVWLRARSRSVTIRAKAADATYALDGRRTWKLKFTRRSCAQAPQVSPSTGS